MARQPERTSVLIVDDHRAFADLLAASLGREPDFTVAGIATTADSAVDIAARTMPDLVVLDIRLGEQDGLSVARRLREVIPGVLLVVVSAYGDPDWVARAAAVGANGYVTKTGSLGEVLHVLRHAAPGPLLRAPGLRHAPITPPADGPAAGALTSREAEVLALLGDGAGPAQIARILGISVHTCRGHIKSLYAKLGARSQLQALALARRRGLFGPDDD